jgi:dipeptidyl-peptidase 4
MRKLPVLSCIALFSICASVFGQGSAADYQRAHSLDQMTRGKVFDFRIEPHWFDGGNKFWYRVDLANGEHAFYIVDAVAGSKEPSAQEPTVSETATTNPTTRPAAGQRFRRRQFNSVSPDGKWEAFARTGKFFLRSRDGNQEIPMSPDGRPGDGYDGNFAWSPDSSHVVAMWTRDGGHRMVYEVQSSPPDQLQPKLISYNYLKPGDDVPVSKPHLFDVAAKKEISVSDKLFSNPFTLDTVRWDADSHRFTFEFNQRGHQAYRIIAVDAATGEAKAIVNEECKTFFDYSGKMFVHYLDDPHQIIWMSERDGWNHLYRYDSLTGKVMNQITKGQWVVRGVDLVDEKNHQIWFRASGIISGQDPYYVHYCRVNFDGTGLVVMTAGDGTHTIQYSPDRRFIIDTYSRVDLAPINELRRVEDGKLICPLETADISALSKIGWKPPLRFVAKGRDGTTDIYGIIHRPMNLDPTKKYPVLEDIYAGPQDSFVPKDFSRYRRDDSMAELGFIVVQIDGMGTSNRSKAFHDVCWKNLGDAGFPDRILWMKAAAAQYPWMDLTRVGVYGTSAGGQSALRALEAFGDFYKVAVSDCGCQDNRMDKIWWNEQWMGWPIGPEYAEQSNVTNARNMNGKLLLIVSELDHNVDPASTMQVCTALIKANKDFDFLVVPNADHGQDDIPNATHGYGERRREDFFVRNLLGVEPRHDS